MRRAFVVERETGTGVADANYSPLVVYPPPLIPSPSTLLGINFGPNRSDVEGSRAMPNRCAGCLDKLDMSGVGWNTGAE